VFSGKNLICKYVSKIEGFTLKKMENQNCLFYDGSRLDKTMPNDKTYGWSFYPPSVKARHDYGVSRIKWRRIANVNGTTEIKLLL